MKVGSGQGVSTRGQNHPCNEICREALGIPWTLPLRLMERATRPYYTSEGTRIRILEVRGGVPRNPLDRCDEMIIKPPAVYISPHTTRSAKQRTTEAPKVIQIVHMLRCGAQRELGNTSRDPTVHRRYCSFVHTIKKRQIKPCRKAKHTLARNTLTG